MSSPEIIIIVAMAQNRVIGMANTIPWHIPEDLQHFKRTTMGHSIIMGRRTWESIGHPLPGRQNIIISRDPAYLSEGGQVASSLTGAIELASKEHEKIFITGGGEIYSQALSLATKIVVSQLQREVAGDVFFPQLNPEQFSLQHKKNIHGSEDFSIQVFLKKNRRPTSTTPLAQPLSLNSIPTP